MVSHVKAQLIATIQFPIGGMVYKSQLWNLILTNTTSTSQLIHVELTISYRNNGQPVLTAVTRTLTLMPGTTQLNSSNFDPIQYNSSLPQVDLSPNGLLPVGEFDLCYIFLKHNSDQVQQIAEQCQPAVIEPLAPPELVYPYNETAIPEKQPQFSWLPPIPTQLFSTLNYQILVAEIMPGQSAADAIQNNLPLLESDHLFTQNLIYPASAPSLEYDKQYAWQIIAKNNEMIVGSSEVWEFSIKQFEKGMGLSMGQLPYVQLKKEVQSNFTLFIGEIKFDYLNETNDKNWNIKVTDLTEENHPQLTLDMDSIPIKGGENLVLYPSRKALLLFKDHHFYELGVMNSRNEWLTIKFEYRKPESNNQ